jgi:pilus assembly protein Flp/PilA
MKTFTNAMKSFIDDESGASAIEYGLIAALVAGVLVAGLGVVNGGLKAAFDAIDDALRAALPT